MGFQEMVDALNPGLARDMELLRHEREYNPQIEANAKQTGELNAINIQNARTKQQEDEWERNRLKGIGKLAQAKTYLISGELESTLKKFGEVVDEFPNSEYYQGIKKDLNGAKNILIGNHIGQQTAIPLTQDNLRQVLDQMEKTLSDPKEYEKQRLEDQKEEADFNMKSQYIPFGKNSQYRPLYDSFKKKMVYEIQDLKTGETKTVDRLPDRPIGQQMTIQKEEAGIAKEYGQAHQAEASATHLTSLSTTQANAKRDLAAIGSQMNQIAKRWGQKGGLSISNDVNGNPIISMGGGNFYDDLLKAATDPKHPRHTQAVADRAAYDALDTKASTINGISLIPGKQSPNPNAGKQWDDTLGPQYAQEAVKQLPNGTRAEQRALARKLATDDGYILPQ